MSYVLELYRTGDICDYVSLTVTSTRNSQVNQDFPKLVIWLELAWRHEMWNRTPLFPVLYRGLLIVYTIAFVKDLLLLAQNEEL